MVTHRTKKIGIISSILLTGVLTAGLYYYASERGPIYNFNPTIDINPILELFDQNWYWLVASENYSPSFMLKHRTPNENPHYFGALKIKIMREHGKFAGFIAYYMKMPQEGIILFLAVGHEFRGKQYGKALAEYAIDDMKKVGAKTIGLWTRVSNVPAQRIYKGLGFTEVFHDPEGYLYFERAA